MSDSPPQPSRLLQYLPAIYAEAPFLGRFLLAFEKLMFGRDDGDQISGQSPQAALDRIVAGMPAYWIPQAVKDDPFLPAAGDDIPRQAPKEFLAWLASWTSFSLRFDLDDDAQRKFIASVISLYRRRGTKGSLGQLLEIFTGGDPQIIDTDGAPHFFRVTAVWRTWIEPEARLRQIAIAKAIVELEKPAHTNFTLDPRFPSMQIEVHSTIGENTILGTVPLPPEAPK